MLDLGLFDFGQRKSFGLCGWGPEGWGPGGFGAAGASHDCTFQGPGASNKHHQNSTKGPPREREESMKIVAGEGKRRAKFCAPTLQGPPPPFGPPPPPSGPPTLRGPTFFQVWAPTPRGPTRKVHRMFSGLSRIKADWPKSNWPNSNWLTSEKHVGLSRIGLSRARPRRHPGDTPETPGRPPGDPRETSDGGSGEIERGFKRGGV